MIKFTILLEQHTRDMTEINQQRRIWLISSSVVLTSVIFLIFGWDWISGFNNISIWWIIISLLLILSVNWWYWTMKVVCHLLEHQNAEYVMIADLLSEIQELKKTINQLTIDKES